MRGVKALTQDKYDSVPALLTQGMDRIAIAELFGVTPSTLQVQCSRKGISLRRGGPRQPRRSLSLTEAALDLSKPALVALREKARSMGIDEVQLASNLLEIIATEDLYRAVLDLEAA